MYMPYLYYLANTIVPSSLANTIQIMKMCQAFKQCGYETKLLANQATSNSLTVSDELWDVYGIREPFEIQLLEPIKFRRLNSYRFALKSAQIIQHNKPQLVFTRQIQSAIGALTIGVPTILEIHAIVRTVTERTLFKLFASLKTKKRIVVISQALEEDLRKEYPQELQQIEIIIAPDGVDLEQFANLPSKRASRNILNLPSNEFIVGYVGHFYAGKGVEVILPLAQSCPNMYFLIVGGRDKEREDVREQIQKLGLKNIQLVSFIPNQTVPNYLSACDVLLLPAQKKISIGFKSGQVTDIARWTSPLKMFEYMASGRPIIASSLPVLQEVLNEKNSFICSYDDIDAWSSTLRQLQSNPGLGEKKAQQAAQDVQQYTWQKRVQKCLDGFLD